MFYEVKANLRHDQLAKLRAGGIRQIQPGIESFSDQVLQLMDKGVTGLQNIQLLRWCEELGIDCAWNLLAGFPGEEPGRVRAHGRAAPAAHPSRPADVVRAAAARPLQPVPRARRGVRLPPHAAVARVLLRVPARPPRAGRLAYFFDFDYDDGRRPEEYLEPVQRAVQDWWEARMSADARPRLDAEHDGDAIVVTDTRRVAVAGAAPARGRRRARARALRPHEDVRVAAAAAGARGRGRGGARRARRAAGPTARGRRRRQVPQPAGVPEPSPARAPGWCVRRP